MAELDTWKVVNVVCDPHTLGQFNSVCTISNGYLGLKGNLAEQRDGYAPTTIINGVYDELDLFSQIRASNEDRRHLDPRYFDTAGHSPTIANLPDPLFARVFVGDREISVGRGELRDFVQVLDLQTGVYRYSFDFVDGMGRSTRIEMERFATLRHAHRVFMRYIVTPLDHDTPVRLHSGISGRVRSNITGERQFKISELWAAPPERCVMVARTPAREHEIRLGVQHTLRNGQPAQPPAGVAEHDAVYTSYVFEPARRGLPIVLERCVVLTSSEDLRHGVVASAEGELADAAEQGFERALAEQRAAWDELWRQCDVQIEGDDPAQLGLRFCIFHLLQAAPRFTQRLSVPVKLLTGEHYQGNVFYDTDLYIVPFYTWTQPRLARTCLNFRYESLRAAREIARNLGCDGAKFAWQSGPDGEECLGRWWRFVKTNVHINADVAYALMHYTWATGDDEFIFERGIDLLVETARFFAARAKHDPDRGCYDLHNVGGPDEGHCESTNNFFTNIMAGHNLRWAAETLEQLRSVEPGAHAAAVRRLALKPDEPARWRFIAERLTLLQDPQSGLCEQCDGFFRLKEIPPDLMERRKSWWVAVAPFKAMNQPDVLMALALLRDEFALKAKQANWDYYKDRSLNFSSMSFMVHALLALEVGDLTEAYRNFIITTGIDLDEALTGRRDTHSGLHGTALGGAWVTAVMGFGGVRLTEQGLRIAPQLPREWQSLRYRITYLGVPLEVQVRREEVTIRSLLKAHDPLQITVVDREISLSGGEEARVPAEQPTPLPSKGGVGGG